MDWIVLSTAGVRDGKVYPFDGPTVGARLQSRAPTIYRTEAVVKLDGANTATVRTVISPDGKTRTQQVTGVDAKGQKVNHTIV